MSPEPYVRAQALALAVTLATATALGSPIATLIVTSVAIVASLGLARRYRGDTLASRLDVPADRARLDAIVVGDARGALAVGLAASSTMVGFDVDPVDVGAVAATPVLLAGAAVAVWLSSLVDFYIVLPRISGQLGPRPCRDPDEDFDRWPRTWRETTRWWYIHRIAAALAVRFGLSLAVSLTAARYISVPAGTTVVAAAAVVFLAEYVQAVRHATWQAGHPTFIVGRTVRRRPAERLPLFTRTIGRRTVRIPGFKRAPAGDPGPPEYVYDVAIEGVNLVPTGERERNVPRDSSGNVEYERNPNKMPLKHIEIAERAERPFSGCARTCSGINWYCVQNPKRFQPK